MAKSNGAITKERPHRDADQRHARAVDAARVGECVDETRQFVHAACHEIEYHARRAAGRGLETDGQVVR